MEIYNLLPRELQDKIKYYVLEHPTARIIKEKIQELRCDEYFVFRDKQNKVFCKVDGKDHFAGEYFLTIKRDGDADSDTTEGDGSATSDDYADAVFNRMFFVSSTTSDDEE